MVVIKQVVYNKYHKGTSVGRT